MEDLTLSDEEIARFERSLRTLLAPLEHQEADSWRREVNRATRVLLGADMATFQLPAPGEDLLVSEEADPSQLRKYIPLLAELDPTYSRSLLRAADLRVCNRAMLWEGNFSEYRESAYYHEFVVPIQAHDMVCAATKLDGESEPAMLYLHHESPDGPRFGARGLRLLSMLFPAFEAGVRAFRRFHALRRSLFRSLDTLADSVCVYDVEGRLLHRNRAFEDLELTNREDEGVTGAVHELARNLGILERERRARSEPGRLVDSTLVTRKIWIGARTFVLQGSILAKPARGGDPAFLVAVREGSAVPGDGRPDREFQPGQGEERFGLTKRQGEVALLLARRLTNREIAEHLGMSLHTARHHTERVLRKLGIRSRRDVLETLLAAEADRP